MTEGKIIKSIIIYAIPLILGNFMQQLYSTVDSFVVGNYVGATALAAVGASGQLTYFLIAFCLGASAGGGILISQFYGAKSYDELHHVIHNMLGIAVVLGLVSTVVGVAFCPQLLRAMGTPEDMMPEAVLYLRIYFGGMIFMTFYNMLAAILNAVGNSTKSLQYLVVSSLVNIALDFLLICGFGMGVEGAAIATVISQGVSSILAFRYLAKVDAPYRVVFRDISLDKYWAMRVVRIGLPAAIQNAVISFSNILIQTGVNAYGTNVVAGFSAYMKVDGFNILPILSFSMAATTFVGQNIGAGKRKRAFQGAAMIFVINLCYTLMMTAIMLGFDTQIISCLFQGAGSHYIRCYVHLGTCPILQYFGRDSLLSRGFAWNRRYHGTDGDHPDLALSFPCDLDLDHDTAYRRCDGRVSDLSDILCAGCRAHGYLCAL